jgi:uncharacterized membrane protein YfcA
VEHAVRKTEEPTTDVLLLTPGVAMDNWRRDHVWSAIAIRLVVAAIPGLFLGAFLGVFSAVVIAIALIVAFTVMFFALDVIVARRS